MIPSTLGRSGPPDGPDRLRLRAWYGYNWGDHGWAAPVAAVLIGPWLLALAKHAVGAEGTLVRLGPLRLRAEAWPSAMVTVAALAQLVVLPFVGSAVDRRQAGLRWLTGACLVGSAVCVLLALTGGREWLLVGGLYLVGSVAEGVSDLTWNGFLGEVAHPDRVVAVSSRGTAAGYLGAGLILGVDLALVSGHATLGLSQAAAVRICFLTAAVWWLGFGLPSLRRLRPPVGRAARPVPPAGPTALPTTPPRVTARLAADLRLLRSMPQCARFVLAYLLFSDAMSAVIVLASTFLTHQLFDDDTTKASPFLFELILVIQFVAVGGALGADRLARRIGARRVLMASLVVWCAVIVFAYLVLDDEKEAVVAGIVIGVVLGATTALSRGLYVSMIPPGREATWFSLYEVCSQGTSWLAPLLFTVVVDVTGSFRQALLSLIVLFAAGLAVLWRTDTAAAAHEAALLGPRR